MLCLTAFRLIEVFNVLFKLFQSEASTEDKAFYSTYAFQ